jgi:hypothetical protein
MQLAIVFQAASAAAISALFCAAPAEVARGDSASGASRGLTLREEADSRRDAGFLPGEPSQAGQIVITEFMKDPSHVTDARGEWIEVWNAMPWRVNLEGWVLSDDSGAQHVIHAASGALRLGPGQYVVLGNNADPALNGGVQVDYAWSSFSLGNGADQIVLSKPDGTLVDRVAYDDGVLWPDTAGRAIALQNSARTAAANDDPANWCHASSPIGPTNTDTGTPRMDNDACP